MKKLLYIALGLLPLSVSGQTHSSLSKNKISIGEQVELVYELQLGSESDKIRFDPKVGMISSDAVSENSDLRSGDKVNLEIAGSFSDSISYEKPMKWFGRYKITAWDTGTFEIPAPMIVLNDSAIQFQPLRLEVVSPRLIDGQGIYETETKFVDIPEDRLAWLKQNWWWLALIAVAGIVALICYRYKKRIPPESPKELSLKDRALVAIDALDAAKLWEKGQLKEHYIELSYILRSYLGARYGLNLLERTSYQATVLLIAQGLAQDTVRTIQLILDQSDLVKFAKSVPPEMEIYKISALARQIVAETSPIEFDV